MGGLLKLQGLQGRIRLPHHPRPFDFGNARTLGFYPTNNFYFYFYFYLFFGVKFYPKEKFKILNSKLR
jgi:hypothetical protein